MDKYLLVVLIFLVAGMLIAATLETFLPALFYTMLGGAIIVIVYASMKSRKEQKELRRKRRQSKK